MAAEAASTKARTMTKRHLEVVQYDHDRASDVYHWANRWMSQAIHIAKTEKHWKVPCTKGCDACCYDIALASSYEVVHLVHAIREMPAEAKALIRSQLTEWVDGMRRAGLDIEREDQEIRRYHRAHVACPLLDRKRHVCMAYEARPYACFGHALANQKRDVCANRANKPVVKTIITTELMEKFYPALLSTFFGNKRGEATIAIGLLPTMLLKAWDLVEAQSPNYEEWLRSSHEKHETKGQDDDADYQVEHQAR